MAGRHLGHIELRRAPGKGRGIFRSPPASGAPPSGCLLASWIREEAGCSGAVADLARRLLVAADFRLSDDGNATDAKTERLHSIAVGGGSAGLEALTLVLNPVASPGLQRQLASLKRCMDLNILVQGEPLMTMLHSAPLMSAVLDSVAALFNHSCLPNADMVLLNGVLVVKATEPVAAGEELTVCYLQPAMLSPVAKRRRMLSQQWGFSCTCRRCRGEEQLDASSQAAMQRLLGVGATFGLADQGNQLAAFMAGLEPKRRRALLAEIRPATEALLDLADARAPEERLLILSATQELLCACFNALHAPDQQEEDAAAVARVLRANLDAVTGLLPCSWGAVEMALMARTWALQAGQADLASESERRMKAVLELRYGPGLDAATLQRLFAAACGSQAQQEALSAQLSLFSKQLR